ncbi:MAG: YjbQ family protein [Bacteroidales bacterium]|nr:YjbQ family protein [Bacteroidales bacterium]
MTIQFRTINLNSNGNTDIIDITSQISDFLVSNNTNDGLITVFTPSATSSLTTIEYESGCLRDLKVFLDQIINPHQEYFHNERWGDGNGHSHLRAALLGPSISIPFKRKKMILGTWQQIIFIDFDTRPRNRELILQIIGDC